MQEGSTSPGLIVGSGRSGTTWVLDCLAEADELRPIFEHLHPGQSALGKRYAYEALARRDKDETLERYPRDLAVCRVGSRRIDYRESNDVLHLCRVDINFRILFDQRTCEAAS